MPGKQNPSESSPEDQVLDSSSDELENDDLETGQEEESLEETEAASSDADDSKISEEERKDLLDVVKDVVKKDDEPSSEDEDSDEDKKKEGKEGKTKEDASSASKDGKSEEDDDASDEFTEEDLAKEKPSTQKRIRSLTGKLEESHSQIEELTPHAESYRKIDGFMQQYGITPEESAEAFTIMALVKTEPDKALQRMQQHVDNIAGVVGESLPDDLKQRVEDGTLDEADAKELSKARATANLERARRETIQTTAKKDEKTRETADANTLLARTLDDWQAKTAETDPDYQKKHGFIKTQLQALVAELGAPQNAEEVLQYANIAKGMVDKQIGEVAPKPQKKEKKSIKSRSASGPSPQPNPETMLDVVRQAASGG